MATIERTGPTKIALCLSVAVFFAACMAAKAQPPRVKGHIIGESIQDFLNESKDLRELVTLCRANPRSDELFGMNTCEDVLDVANGAGRVVITEKGAGELLGRPERPRVPGLC